MVWKWNIGIHLWEWMESLLCGDMNLCLSLEPCLKEGFGPFYAKFYNCFLPKFVSLLYLILFSFYAFFYVPFKLSFKPLFNLILHPFWTKFCTPFTSLFLSLFTFYNRMSINSTFALFFIELRSLYFMAFWWIRK